MCRHPRHSRSADSSRKQTGHDHSHDQRDVAAFAAHRFKVVVRKAQKKAEAENVKLRDALMRVPFGKDELQRLGETEND